MALDIALVVVGLLIFVVSVISLVVSIWLAIRYSKYNKRENSAGYTGQEIARKILDDQGLSHIKVSVTGSLMFGNLIRECGVLERLSKTAQNELANLVTILLGITIGGTMVAENFLRLDTLLIMALGLFAFVFDTAGGVLFAKFLNMFRKTKINPMIGASGISAFPMSARVIQKIAKEEDPYNFILMQSISANVSGQLGSIVAGGMVITLVSMMLGGIW